MSNRYLDPRIGALADRRDVLRAEAAEMDARLSAYADAPTCVPAAVDSPALDPLRHHGVSDSTPCGCGVCVEWRLRREELARAMRLVPRGHRWSICACGDCRFVGRMQLNCIAAANRRDLLIEVSFHASHHSRHGGAVMDWLDRQLRLPRYDTAWCAYELGRRPVDEWLTRCEAELSPVLSGTVFVAGAGGKIGYLVPWTQSQIGSAMAELAA